MPFSCWPIFFPVPLAVPEFFLWGVIRPIFLLNSTEVNGIHLRMNQLLHWWFKFFFLMSISLGWFSRGCQTEGQFNCAARRVIKHAWRSHFTKSTLARRRYCCSSFFLSFYINRIQSTLLLRTPCYKVTKWRIWILFSPLLAFQWFFYLSNSLHSRSLPTY